MKVIAMSIILAAVFTGIARLVAATPLAGGTTIETVRPVRLQLCAPTSGAIVWDTDLPADSVVLYGPDYQWRAEGRSGTTHIVYLRGLTPDTEYPYRALSAGQEVGRGVFQTAKGSEATSISFIAISDTGYGEGGDRYQGGQARVRDRLETVLAEGDYDFVLHAGDVEQCDGAPHRYDLNYFEPYENIISSLCVFPTMGNHDQLNGGQAFEDAFLLPANNDLESDGFYSFDYGRVHFATVASDYWQHEEEHLVRRAAVMKAWLENDLREARANPEIDWVVVWLHHPPYSRRDTAAGLNIIRQELVPIFEAYADVVIAGHHHSLQRIMPDHNGPYVGGTTYYIVAGGGAPLQSIGKRWAPQSAHAWKEFGFMTAQVTPTEFTTQFIAVDGRVLDTHVIRKSSPNGGR